ncbi:MAG: YlbF family regulator, partial [bacterium]|nr:YlbF family regulator [bacterium]
MSIYDKAHELSRILKLTPEYGALIVAKTALTADKAARDMFLDFRKKEMSLQSAILAGHKDE